MIKKILFVIIFLFNSCSKESNDNQENNLTSELTNNEIVEYFKSIALGFEYGDSSEITRRWEEDINLYLGGNITNQNFNEINRIINEQDRLEEVWNSPTWRYLGRVHRLFSRRKSR